MTTSAERDPKASPTSIARLEDRAASALSAVLRACEDGEKGYRSAALDVDDRGYQLMLGRYAEERAGFARALASAVRGLGDSTIPGSALGALHRTWLDAKAAIAGDRPKAVLTECRRGEDAALETYRAALHTDSAARPSRGGPGAVRSREERPC